MTDNWERALSDTHSHAGLVGHARESARWHHVLVWAQLFNGSPHPRFRGSQPSLPTNAAEMKKPERLKRVLRRLIADHAALSDVMPIDETKRASAGSIATDGRESGPRIATVPGGWVAPENLTLIRPGILVSGDLLRLGHGSAPAVPPPPPPLPPFLHCYAQRAEGPGRPALAARAGPAACRTAPRQPVRRCRLRRPGFAAFRARARLQMCAAYMEP